MKHSEHRSCIQKTIASHALQGGPLHQAAKDQFFHKSGKDQQEQGRIDNLLPAKAVDQWIRAQDPVLKKAKPKPEQDHDALQPPFLS